LLITRFHYLVDQEKIKKLALDRELEDNDRNYHWKIYGINEEKSLLTTIYLFDSMEQALEQKEVVDIIAELQSEVTDMREYEFYEVMVDPSILCKAPIYMVDLGIKDVEYVFEAKEQT
jgi:hypothetical protein